MYKYSKPLLSLYKPTNGMAEWVFPTIESIYAQKYDELKFKVIVTENGNNSKLKDIIAEYTKKYNNNL